MLTLFYRLPRLSVLAIALVLFAGLGAILTLGRQEDPTLVERYGYVLTVLPGADAERMEALVTDPIEALLQELPEIDRIDSSSRQNVSQVGLDLREDLTAAEIDDAWTLIRAQVQRAQADLPVGASVPRVERVYLGASTLVVALTWEGDGDPQLAILARMAEALEDIFQNLPGTEETEVYGLPSEEIRVVVNTDALAAAGLDTGEAARRIAAADSKSPAGQLKAGELNLGLDVGGEFDSIARIRAVQLLQSPDGSALRVGDVADVRKAVQTPEIVSAYADGQRTVFVGAFIQPNQRVDLWAEAARRKVGEFATSAPRGIRVETVFDQSAYTTARLGDLARNLMFSAGIVFAVLFLCIGWRAAIAVGTALPLTVCLVLILFNVFGMPLHQMSVTGLVISLGLLIDNAIVVVDEIDQKRARGESRLEAIRASLHHLAGPLFASTLTTALAFAPIALLPGSAGEFVGMIGMSVIFAVVASFAISMTVIPALYGWIDRRRPQEGGRVLKRRWYRDGIVIDAISDGYRWSVERVLRFPPLGIAIGIVPAAIGFVLAGQLPAQFFPQTERDQFQLELTLPLEASLEETRSVVERVTDRLRSYDEIEHVYFVLGEPAPRVYYNTVNNTRGQEGFAAGWAKTTSPAATRAIIADVQETLREAFPEGRLLALPFEQGPPVNAPIEFYLVGSDFQTLGALGDEARRILANTPGVTYTAADLTLGSPKYTLRADEAASALAGSRLTELAAGISAEVEGRFAGSILEGTEELPVRVVASDERRGELSDLRSKTIGVGEDGLGTPLSALGEVVLEPDISRIVRRDGERVNRVFAYLEPYTLPAPVFAEFRARLDAAGFETPPGYDLLIGGEAEASGDALGNLAATGVPLMLVIAGAVALVFNSFRMAGLILIGGVLAVGLAFFGVWLFNLPRGFNAIIGALGLFGIAINGSIVVLSLLKSNRAAMADDVIAQREVVVDATRHIVATTLTTMGGFVPLLIAGDAFWMPLAAGISGGVAGSALLALYFIPAVFRIMTMKPITRAWRALSGQRPPPSPATQPAQ